MYHFNSVEFFLDQFDNCIILGGCLDEFQKQAVFAVVNDLCLEGFGDLKQLYLICSRAFLDFDIKNFLHTDKDICEVNDLDHFDHAV